MDKFRHIKTVALIASLTMLVSGCAQTKSWLSTVRTPTSLGSSDDVLGAPDADAYLEELRLLSSNDLASHAEIYADARAGAQLTPNPSTRLRYALVLATPGHAESDASEAQSLLRELLTQTELLTNAEIALANIYLASIEDRVVLEAETRRLRASSSRAAQTQEAALNERLAIVETENRMLKRQLEEAESKLDAITSIERSIREQEQ
ncbi:MAG: hypothetical protein QNJ19_00555 [Woeseiaceae bacterium]|nr:hypothetical protein [Woeseiaceae bacterium]